MNPAAVLPAQQQQEEPPRTRCGYTPGEVIHAFQRSMTQTGTFATGRALHFAADLVCSGGIQTLIKLLWDYALTHIGIASPRVFVYLKKRIGELEDLLKTLPDETAYQREDFQVRVGEILLVLRNAPTRSVVPWPKVGAETHADGWIRAALVDPVSEPAVLRKVWRPEGDASLLRTAGAQLCKAITEGSVERALFWIKWLLEEDAIVRKAEKGAALSTIERGPPTAAARVRTEVSYFILHLYAEIYKELALKSQVRMHEEFQSLLDLWKSPPKGMGAGARKCIFTILTQILAEVPKWRVPAAATLIQDPVALSRTVAQVPKLFREVLAYAPPGAGVVKFMKKGSGAPKESKKKKTTVESQMSAMDRALEEYFQNKLSQ